MTETGKNYIAPPSFDKDRKVWKKVVEHFRGQYEFAIAHNKEVDREPGDTFGKEYLERRRAILVMDKYRKDLEIIVKLAQGLVNTHQIITVGTSETACVRIADINRLDAVLKKLGGKYVL